MMSEEKMVQSEQTVHRPEILLYIKRSSMAEAEWAGRGATQFREERGVRIQDRFCK